MAAHLPAQLRRHFPFEHFSDFGRIQRACRADCGQKDRGNIELQPLVDGSGLSGGRGAAHAFRDQVLRQRTSPVHQMPVHRCRREGGAAREIFPVNNTLTHRIHLPVPRAQLVGGRKPPVGMREFLDGPPAHRILEKRDNAHLPDERYH